MITGEVKVNEQDIITWEAEYVKPAVTPGFSLYRVRAKGYHAGRAYDKVFQVPHVRNSGPLVLASIVMCEIANVI